MHRTRGEKRASPGRRALLAWLGTGMATGLLPACGGGAGRGQGGALPAEDRLPTSAQLDAMAADLCRQGLVGVVLGRLAGPDARLELGVAGRTRLDGGRLLEGGERFMIGSDVKAMTAALAGLCVERGLLGWDSRPAELMPELAAHLHPDYRLLTLALILDHKGGLPAFDRDTDFRRFVDFAEAGPGAALSIDPDRRRLAAAWLLSQAPAFPAGRAFLYSNAGYWLAGAMLEAASGQSYETLFSGLLDAPLGLDLHWGQPSNGDMPQGHVGPSPGALASVPPLAADVQRWNAVGRPGGADAQMSAEGCGRWLRAHLQGLQGRQTPLPAANLDRLRTLTLGDYALGWQAQRSGGRPMLTHSGISRGFLHMLGMSLDGQLGVFAATNTFGTDADGRASWSANLLNRSLAALLAT